jgi:ferric-chelate reductase [NAD(P)H]
LREELRENDRLAFNTTKKLISLRNISRRISTMSAELDRKVFNDLSYGLYVLTSHDEDRLNGQIVNSVIQVTYDPVRVAVTVNKKNLTHSYISQSRAFAISVLDHSTPISFFELFGFRSGRDVDKLSKVRFKLGNTGCPVIEENAISVMEALVFKEIDLGTHTIFIGNATASEVLGEGRPLTYNYYRKDLNGDTSPTAPNFSPVD